MWFQPRCPVDSVQKQWIESRWEWLSHEFGRTVENRTRRGPVISDRTFSSRSDRASAS